MHMITTEKFICENWDIAWVDAEAPAPLVQRFLDPTVFKRKPAM